MDEFKIMARILAAVKAGQDLDAFNVALVSEEVLKCTEKTRDRLALMMQEEGYIKGLYVIDGIDNQEAPVILWEESKPRLTITGMEFIQTSKPMQAAIKSIKEAGISTAATMVANALGKLI